MATSFEGAPLCRIAFVSSALNSLFLSSSTKAKMSLDLGRVLARGEVWRLLTHHIAFESLGETVIGAVHLYRFRRFERMLGSRKFGAFALIACSLATSLATGIVFVVGERGRDQGAEYMRIASGPYALIFSMYSLFYSLVPAARPRLVGIAGLDISDKSLMYLAAAQLLLSSGLRSFVPGACGLLAGAAYLSDALKLYTLALPKSLDRFLVPATPSSPDFSARSHGASQDIHRDNLPEPFAPPPEPSQAHVDSLVAMGFDRDRAVDALRSSGNNLEVAANSLLSG
ncbi:hypothetical protein CTAYLR_000828 [Chrysophaeum taylorii]|uniref:UBA domain-containing protein n=1 Tax=Chrysophaeum taylorii TaxID=2483200 RepID=A0AAD7XUT9_9STRA|nr:hypothetical protein CTAYLR_000828 [Chrysophaeum taylorii]